MKQDAMAVRNSTEAEIDAAFSRGAYGIWERRAGLRKVVGAKAQAIAEKFCEEEVSLGEKEAIRLNDERLDELTETHWIGREPLWQQISGLYSGSHVKMSPNERAGRIRLLLRRVERMMRWEMKQMDGEKGERGDEGTERAVRFSEVENGERSVIGETVFWSPMRTICVYLEISQRHLSGLCREITGLAIQEIVDRIKAETLRASFKERLKGFVLEWFGVKENREAVKGLAGRGAPFTVAEEIFAALKATRRGARFHRTQWAMELGFSSYQRLFRAALLAEGLTPHQMEIAVIEGLIPAEDAVCAGGQNEEGSALQEKDENGSAGDGLKPFCVPGKPAKAG